MNPILRFIARYLRRNVPQYAVGAVMLIATNWVVVRIPALIGETLNVLESGGSAAVLASRELALELVGLGLLVIVVRALSRVLFFNPGRDVEYRLGVDLFGRLLGLQRPFFMKNKVGELVSIATNDTTSVRLLAGFAGLQVLNVAVAVPLHLYQMWVTDAVLTLWCLAPIAFGAAYMRWTVQRFFGMIRESMALLARLSDSVLEAYSGVAAIRSHATEAAALARFEELNTSYLQLQLRIARIRAFGMPVLGFSGLVGAGLVLWVGGGRVLDGQMRIGDMATFTALLMSLVSILTGLAWVLAAVSRGVVSLRRVDKVLQTTDELPSARTALDVVQPPALELRDLGFTYPDGDEPALEGISARIAPGKTLGIFGKTGSGKTTLINLLARVHTPKPGTVFVNDKDVNDVELAELREATAVVPQSAFLFSTSLKENVRLSGANLRRAAKQPSAATERDDDPRLDAVLEAACLRDDIGQLPAGLDTVVGERGVMLSGGQRQRAALARALYRQRPILLLDDVLSAVDQGTETKMVEAIRRLRGGSLASSSAPTTVIVSHRTSVLEHADEILVLDHGRVIERGRHEELLAAGGEYAKTHLHQGAAR